MAPGSWYGSMGSGLAGRDDKSQILCDDWGTFRQAVIPSHADREEIMAKQVIVYTQPG
jgi:hypothetical protein